jgi:transposase
MPDTPCRDRLQITINTGIKHIKRTGRGYRNAAHYQARILLTSAARRAA